MNDFLMNDVLVSDQILQAMKNMDPIIAEAADKKAQEICLEIFPNVNFQLQENIDLVVRPLSAVIALNEMVLQEMYESSSLDGILNSKTIPEGFKVKMFQNFAKLNNIPIVSSDPASMYSEIVQRIRNNNINNMEIFSADLYKNFPDLNRLFFVDDSMPEMERNKIPYIQIDHAAIMTFERSEHNRGTLIDGAYLRDDYQTYQEYKEADRVAIPGVVDVYFSTPTTAESITVSRGEDGVYELPEEYYINIDNDRHFVVIEDDRMRWGITKIPLRVFVIDGGAEETFLCYKYRDPQFENYKNRDALVVRDPMFKGFFPLLVHFTLYTKEDIDIYALRASMVSFLDSIGGSMKIFTVSALQQFLHNNGFDVVVSTSNPASFFISAAHKIEMDTIFPLTMRDIQIPAELHTSQVSENTIRIFVGDINVIKE